MSRSVELMVRVPSPSVMCDPDAVDMESAEEGWRSEDPQRRGVAARCTAGVLSRPGAGAAPPARHTATRDVARSAAPHRCRVAAAPTRRCARLSTSWTTPVGFADLVSSTSQSRHDRRPTTASTATATGPQTHVVNVSFRQVLPTTTATPPPAPAATDADGGGARGGRRRAAAPHGPVPAPAPKPVAPAPAPAARHDRAGVVVRRAGRHLCQPDPGVRDGGDGDRRRRPGRRSGARSTTARRTTRAGSSTSPRPRSPSWRAWRSG